MKLRPVGPAATFGIALCLWGGGCLADLHPEVGPLRAGLCEGEDSDFDREVSFANDIAPLLARPAGSGGCTCHRRPVSGPIDAIETAGLELTEYDTLMRGGAHGAAVAAGDPCGSNFYLKLSAAPPFGSRMPFDGPPYLTASELQLVHDWIAEGARDN